MKKKWKIILIVLVILAIVAFYIYRTLFPSGPVLDHVDNPISDRATKDWATIEASVSKNPNRNAYFGDLHVHTGFSFDAYIGGIVAEPSEAYAFAKGGSIDVLGQQVKLEKPLDFAAVTDHSEFLGELYSIRVKGAPGHNTAMARFMRDVTDDTLKQARLFNTLLRQVGRSQRSHIDMFKGYETTASAWDIAIKAAEDHYEPGEFTTFAAYEWTLGNGLAHLHRNVFFKDMTVPKYPISSLEARDEIALWKSLDTYRKEGSTCMAVPHNSNLSEGGTFAGAYPDGSAIDQNYVETRNRNEPLVEIHQAKGNAEVHPALWSNDEFADFAVYTQGEPKKNNYVRHVLKKGLELEDEFGINPYKYGIIGSTDTHNATPGNTEEDDDFIGNHAGLDFDVQARLNRQWILDTVFKVRNTVNPGGLIGVWAESNTRTSIYDAMAQKETFATSGGRIQLRFFAGSEFDLDLSDYDTFVKKSYAQGVSMGQDLILADGQTPEFVIWAAKDPDGAHLDRVQVIKGWYSDGELQEHIYDAVISSNPYPDRSKEEIVSTLRAKENEGYGSTELKVIWQDPDFDASQRAFYYLRVLEVPTPRFSLIDEMKYGVKYPKSTELVVRERAWSSPIWYSPG